MVNPADCIVRKAEVYQRTETKFRKRLAAERREKRLGKTHPFAELAALIKAAEAAK